MNPYRTARLKYRATLERAAEILNIEQETLERIENNGTPTDQLAKQMATLYRDPNLISEHAERLANPQYRPKNDEGHTPRSDCAAALEFYEAALRFRRECTGDTETMYYVAKTVQIALDCANEIVQQNSERRNMPNKPKVVA